MSLLELRSEFMFALVLVYHIMCSALTHIIYISPVIRYYIMLLGRLLDGSIVDVWSKSEDLKHSGRIRYFMFISYAHISCSYKSHLYSPVPEHLVPLLQELVDGGKRLMHSHVVCRMITLLQGE